MQAGGGLKLIDPKQPGGGEIEDRPGKRRRIEDHDGGAEGMTEVETDFVRLLQDELEKFNGFFVEQEEEYIIRLKELQDRLARAKDSRDVMINIRKEIVDFHEEMVLLENYSALNYTEWDNKEGKEITQQWEDDWDDDDVNDDFSLQLRRELDKSEAKST